MEDLEIKQLEDYLQGKSIKEMRDHLIQMHPADAAEFLESIDWVESRRVLTHIQADNESANIIFELHPKFRMELIQNFSSYKIATFLKYLESDDAIKFIDGLDSGKITKIARYLPKKQSKNFLKSLDYTTGTAGRLMQQNVVTADSEATVKEFRQEIESGKNLPEVFYNIFLLDRKKNPIGLIPISQLMQANASDKLEEISKPIDHIFSTDSEVKEIIDSFQQYDTISAPVVDSKNKIVGTITVDDVLDWADEEAEKEAPKMFGIDGQDNYRSQNLYKAMLGRFSWLSINLIGAIVLSFVISLFENTITQMALLAALMPLVASLSGTATCQSASIMIRSLSTGDQFFDKLIMKELILGFINGLVFALMMFGLIIIWKGDILLGLIAFGAIIVSMTIAGIAGALIPLILSRVGFDPAIGSSIFTTTITDCISFLTVLIGAIFIIGLI